MAPTVATSPLFFVYVLRCSDGSLYVGRTQDIASRVEVHNAGRGASWTASRRPVTLVYQEYFPSELLAVRREAQLKGWTHAKKEALIAGNIELLRSLSKSRNG